MNEITYEHFRAVRVYEDVWTIYHGRFDVGLFTGSEQEVLDLLQYLYRSQRRGD